MQRMTLEGCTKRIQPARGWCATVPQSGGLFGGTLYKLYPPTPPLRRPGLPVFWGSQPCVPAAWLAERLLLAGDIESNPGPRPTLNSAINDNKIPQIWKLANIIPITKPNKDINMGTSYRPISLLSVIAKTLEKVILPYITQNIPNIPTQHGFKTKHYTTSTTQ